MSRFKLAGILRARRAQEDAAKADVMRARRDAAAAEQEALALGGELEARAVEVPPQMAAAFAATMAARQSLAADFHMALERAERRRGAVQQNLSAWTAASSRRRAVEKLAERHETERRRAEDAADQRAVDDIATTRRRKND